jgi:hypothetical protein
MAEAIDSILITPAAWLPFDNSFPPRHNSSPSRTCRTGVLAGSDEQKIWCGAAILP